MKKIELKSLYLTNFKGIRDLKISCEDVTNIYGANATGKTTFKDAMKWLLFGKDSNERTDSGKGAFNIKTLDGYGKAIPGIEHSVTGEWLIDGASKILKRTFREKWTKKRGEADSTLTGHETKFWVDEVPVTAGEYHQEVSGIIEETLFKLITDPIYFSSHMHWQERRKILDMMIDEITVDEVISRDTKLEELRTLIKDTDIEKLKKKIGSQKKNLNEELKAIPVRIDECNNAIVETEKEAHLRNELQTKQDEISRIEEQLTDATKEDPSIVGKRKELIDLRAKVNGIEEDKVVELFEGGKKLRTNLQNLKNEKVNKEQELTSTNQQIDWINTEIGNHEEDYLKYTQEWAEKKAEEFVLNDDFVCPTCGQKLPEDTIIHKKKELEENFNTSKAEALRVITTKGKNASNELEDAKKRLTETQKKRTNLQNVIKELNQKIKTAEDEVKDFENSDAEYSKEYYELRDRVKVLSEEIKTPQDIQEKVDELKARKTELTEEVNRINGDLHKVETNKTHSIRIEELKSREKEVSRQIAELEKNEFLCERFIRAKVKLLDTKINSMFSFVRFKLFDEQINGGLTETCEALIDGVPFSDANNAAKINAGIDIINTLCRYYDVSAPIVIDNRESINEIIPTNSQVINLIVSLDQKLKVA